MQQFSVLCRQLAESVGFQFEVAAAAAELPLSSLRSLIIHLL